MGKRGGSNRSAISTDRSGNYSVSSGASIKGGNSSKEKKRKTVALGKSIFFITDLLHDKLSEANSQKRSKLGHGENC